MAGVAVRIPGRAQRPHRDFFERGAAAVREVVPPELLQEIRHPQLRDEMRRPLHELDAPRALRLGFIARRPR